MIVLRVVAVYFVSCMMLASAEVNAQDRADQLRAIERARLRSLVDADIPTASRLHADDFELIYPQGGTLSREQYLQRIASGDLNYLEWEPGEIRVRLYGNSAVIRHQARLRISVKGSPGRAVRFWHTDLYEKRKGPWQIVWSHATQVNDEIRGAAEATTSKLSDEKQIVEIVQKWQDDWNRHDIKALASCLAEDADVSPYPVCGCGAERNLRKTTSKVTRAYSKKALLRTRASRLI
jgi:ketosteroid isomerase-like protein